jgi:glycosyltransferase involved in cell wall biosynthesis
LGKIPDYVCQNQQNKGKKQMKILHTLFSLDPVLGGPSKACLEMCVALALQGVKVSIYSTDYFSSEESLKAWKETNQNLPAGLEIKMFPVFILTRGLAFSLQMIKAIKKNVTKFDLVHIHSLYLFHSLFSGYYSRLSNTPYIIRPHGTLDPFLFKRKRPLKWLMETLFQNKNLKLANAIHYTTEDEMKLAAPNTFGAPGFIIPNGLNISEYESLPTNGYFRQQYPETIGKKIILFFSRINFKKGLDILIPAFIELAQKHSDYHLVLAGPDDSNLLPGIKEQLMKANISLEGPEQKVTITGMLTGKNKLAVLNDSDVFVLPSYTENFGIAVIEAMICKLPVIISDKVNIWREIVADGAGLAGPCNKNWLASKIENLLSKPTLSKKMGIEGHNSVKRKYGWDKIALSLKEKYLELIQQ